MNNETMYDPNAPQQPELLLSCLGLVLGVALALGLARPPQFDSSAWAQHQAKATTSSSVALQLAQTTVMGAQNKR